jgi:hypothetical protein
MDKIEILGWDVLNIIFNYLKPRDIILISTSINTNFYKCVKSTIYSDHVLINKRHKFENSQPCHAILDFHLSQIKYVDDSYYVALCSKNNSCTDLFEKIINPLTPPNNLVYNFAFPKYIEQYFVYSSNFKCISSCCINRRGSGLDKIILKIVLPELPDGVKYVSSPYDIISNIRLEISNLTFFEYTSSQLKHLDFITQLFKSTDNVIYYYIDLGSFFKKSKQDFYGFRLCDLDRYGTIFTVQLDDIFSIIENKIDPTSEQYHEIKNLLIRQKFLLVKYHQLINILPKPINQTINRSISWGYSCDECKSIELNMSPKWHNRGDLSTIKIKNLMLCFNQKLKLNSCFILLDGADVSDTIKLKNNCVLDRYVFDLNLNIVQHAIINVRINFADSVKNINVDAFFETENIFTYNVGKAFW